MSNPLRQASVIEPELSDVLTFFKRDLLATLNCAKIGQIQSFNASSKTATIQILFKQLLPNNTIVSYPVILDCPVMTLQGGGGSIQFPIASGDQCLVLFSDSRIDEWLQSGAEAVPGDGRSHNISDGIAIVGLNALNSTLPTYPSDKVVLQYHSSSIKIDSTSIKAVATGTAELDLDTKATLKNGTTTLGTLMVNFITLLETIAVQDDEGGAVLPLTPAFIALLEAFKANFQALLG